MRSGSGRGANSLRSEVVGPGENQRDRKPDQQKHDDQAERPVGQLPRRENGRADLNDKSSGDNVSCGDSINFSPSHFFKEAAHTKRLDRHIIIQLGVLTRKYERVFFIGMAPVISRRRYHRDKPWLKSAWNRNRLLERLFVFIPADRGRKERYRQAKASCEAPW